MTMPSVVDKQSSTLIGNSLTLSIDCTGTSLLFIQILVQSFDVPPSTGTYNGVDFLSTGLVATSGQLDSVGTEHYLYKVGSPANGIHDVVVTTPSPAFTRRFFLGAVSIKDSSTTAPLGTVATVNSGGGSPATSPDPNPASAVGDLVIDFVSASNAGGSDTPDASQTQLWETTAGGFEIGCSTKAGAAGTTSMTWSAGGGASFWSTIAVAVKPVTADMASGHGFNERLIGGVIGRTIGRGFGR